MKDVIMVYDDRSKPGDEIREITGVKSFGRIIYRRKCLRDIFESAAREAAEKSRLKADIRDYEDFKRSCYKETGPDAAVLLIFSDCMIKEGEEFSVILKKAGYCEEDFRVMSGDNVAAVIFHSREAFIKASDAAEGVRGLREKVLEYDGVENDAFYDISRKEQFLSFITGGFEARFFNSLSGDEYTVVKRSSNKDKIRREYSFYYLLPENMRSWFVLPYDYKDEGSVSSYKMQRYHMTDLAIRYVHGAISTEEFEKILNIIFHFLSERAEKRVTWNDFYEKRKELYIDKVEKRIEELKAHPDFKKISNFIISGTPYSGIDEIVKRYEEKYDSMIGKKKEELRQVVSHGDLCFSNILYSPETSLMRLIDPRGAEKNEEIYSDPLYDVAKLSHSISGQYDFINSGLFVITLDDSMGLKLEMDSDVREYKRIFERKLKEAGVDVPTVRLFECSLFLSMLPLHIDRPGKVMAFILNAVKILDEI